jgi:hypothetical protein
MVVTHFQLVNLSDSRLTLSCEKGPVVNGDFGPCSLHRDNVW